MEVEVGDLVGAQRSPSRSTYRNGYRPRRWDARVGTIELAIPNLRRGSYFPSLLEPRRRAERALLAVVQEEYVHVSTRKVDELAQAQGIAGLSATIPPGSGGPPGQPRLGAYRGWCWHRRPVPGAVPGTGSEYL